MIELKKDTEIIQEVLKTYYNENEFIHNKEDQLFMCPTCCIEYIEDEWVYSIIHSNMINSLYVEEAMIILMELIKKGIDLKMSSGQFFIFDEENEIQEIIFADDVWEYMAMYDVTEDFAIIALTARLMEDQAKEDMN